tara:strand:- start:943 stop:1587 length:645 start_codon:yes stop_codon:yes gene_type:complete
MVSSNFKLGIFDHSGVLSDDRLPVYESNMVLLVEYGCKRISFREWLEASKASAADFIESLIPGVNKEEIHGKYKQVYTHITTRDKNPITPFMYPETLSFINKIHKAGLNLAVVSTHPQENLLDELSKYRLIDYFHEISGENTPKSGKIKSICKQFDTDPKNAFFVEDSIYGLQEGHKAGVKTFGITTGYHSRKMLKAEKPVAVVNSLTELLEHI